MSKRIIEYHGKKYAIVSDTKRTSTIAAYSLKYSNRTSI